MKSKLLLIGIVAFVSACAGIQKQNKINDQMKDYVFSSEAPKVYAAAEGGFEKMQTPIETKGKNQGASKWVEQDSQLGEKKYKEKSRFTVKVASLGKGKSKLRVFRESQSNLSGDWGKVTPGRMLIYEYNILQKVNPKAAAKIEQNAVAK